MRPAVLNVLTWALMATSATVAQEAGTDVAEAVARLAAAQRAAIAQAPGLRALVAGFETDAADRRREAASGSPYVEWQSEGLGGSGRQPNGADYLRVGTPFNLPGQIGRARALVRSADAWQDDAATAAGLATAAETAKRWIAVAAALEREALQRARLERLDEALNLQEARYQLGEIAGSEVRQLDLEHVGQSSRLALVRAERAAAEAALAELCGDACGEVRIGDLGNLAAASRTPGVATIDDERLAAGPFLRRARSDSELAQAAADLVRATAWGRGEIEAEWERVPALEGMPSFDAWGFRVAVPLPIGVAGHREREAARARADRASAELEAARRQARRTVVETFASAEGAAARLRALEPAVEELPFTDRSLAEQFRLGAISYLAYIDGLNRFDSIVGETIDARAALLLARLELALTLGDTSVFPLPATAVHEED